MSNYRISRLDELFTGRIPLHAVDFAGDPLDVRWIVTKFGKARNWQDVIKRVVKTKDNFFASVGAAVVLLFQFIAESFSVLNGFQAVNGRLSKIATLAKRVRSVLHSGQAGKLTAAVTQTCISHSLLPSSRAVLDFSSAILAMDKSLRGWALAAVSTKPFGFQAMIPSSIVSRMLFFVLLTVGFPFARHSVTLLSLASLFSFFVYNEFSHAIQAPVLNGLVRPVREMLPLSGSFALYHNTLMPVSIGK